MTSYSCTLDVLVQNQSEMETLRVPVQQKRVLNVESPQHLLLEYVSLHICPNINNIMLPHIELFKTVHTCSTGNLMSDHFNIA